MKALGAGFRESGGAGAAGQKDIPRLSHRRSELGQRHGREAKVKSAARQPARVHLTPGKPATGHAKFKIPSPRPRLLFCLHFLSVTHPTLTWDLGPCHDPSLFSAVHAGSVSRAPLNETWLEPGPARRCLWADGFPP